MPPLVIVAQTFNCTTRRFSNYFSLKNKLLIALVSLITLLVFHKVIGWLAENNIITLELIDFSDITTDDDDLSTFSLFYDYNKEDYPRNIFRKITMVVMEQK
jgi:hypothetical protein